MRFIRSKFSVYVACAVCVTAGSPGAAAHVRHHSVHHLARAHRLHARHPSSDYGSPYDPTPTCRYPDGTPYDPDIIGGPNHVGDGGPAGNLGGYDPCGY